MISYSVAGAFSGPITAFSQVAQGVARGDCHWRMKAAGGDEFGELATAFNRMVEGLAERNRLARFVSQDVIEAVAAAPGEENLQPGGEKTEVSVLFSHIRGFTRLTAMHEPEEIVGLLNDFFTAMEEAIQAHGGRIDKLIGDAVMAAFREAPGVEPHPHRACRAALAMRQAVQSLNRKRAERGLFTIDTGIGIASGPVISGRIGSDQGRLDYTIIGNTVNLAARLEAQSHKAMRNHIIIAPSTIQALKGAARVNFLERTEIKGRSRTFPLYELMEMRS